MLQLMARWAKDREATDPAISSSARAQLRYRGFGMRMGKHRPIFAHQVQEFLSTAITGLIPALGNTTGDESLRTPRISLQGTVQGERQPTELTIACLIENAPQVLKRKPPKCDVSDQRGDLLKKLRIGPEGRDHLKFDREGRL